MGRCCVTPSPGTPGEGWVGVYLGMLNDEFSMLNEQTAVAFHLPFNIHDSSSSETPTLPSPGVPGEGNKERLH